MFKYMFINMITSAKMSFKKMILSYTCIEEVVLAETKHPVFKNTNSPANRLYCILNFLTCLKNSFYIISTME